jgi:uncharacterized OB-fold protein
VTGVTISVCGVCGWRGFPLRLWCPRCGNPELAEAVVDRGVVEETTIVVRAVGRAGEASRLATVLLDGGGRVVAALDAAEPGSAVRLESADGVIRARGM